MDIKAQTGFFLRHLHLMPTPYGEEDASRMTLGMFVLGALDVLGTLRSRVPPEELSGLQDWVYAQQVPTGGFRGSPGSGPPANTDEDRPDPLARGGNVVMTYSALNVLSILRDDFTRLDKAGVARLLHACQQADGSFVVSPGTKEADVRYIYAALAVAHHLDLWSAIDVPRTLSFLARCRTYDCAFSQAPGQESHGGSTYCAVASLALTGELPRWRREGKLDGLPRWLLGRQVRTSPQEEGVGFSGRRGKEADVCYSFWCGATLALLGHHDWINERDVAWILSCQSPVGGIAKVPDHPPDVMHAYLGLAALSLHANAPDHRRAQDQDQDQDQDQRQDQDQTPRASAGPAATPTATAAPACGARHHPDLPLLAIDPGLNLALPSAQWAREHLHSRAWAGGSEH